MSSISAPRRPGIEAIVGVVGCAVRGWWAAYTAWRIERWAICRLTAMSDCELKDIGIVRSQIPFAVKRAT